MRGCAALCRLPRTSTLISRNSAYKLTKLNLVVIFIPFHSPRRIHSRLVTSRVTAHLDKGEHLLHTHQGHRGRVLVGLHSLVAARVGALSLLALRHGDGDGAVRCRWIALR